MPWTNTKPDISLVIPVYRGAHRVPQSLAQLEEFAQRTPLGLQIIFVDDGSDDNAGEHLMKFAAERDAVMLIQHEKNVGKGRSVADGIAVATGATVAFTDIDLPYDLSALELMHAKFAADPRVHMLVGSRHHPDSVLENPYGISRQLASWAFMQVARGVSRSKFTDAQCGIKGFRLDAARLLFSDLIVSRFAFDVELFIRAHKFGLLFEEIPVIFRHETQSTVKLVPASVQMAKDLWRLRSKYGSRS